MPSLNEAVIMGHMVRDAEQRMTPSGVSITNFSLATSFGQGDSKKSEFHNIIAFNSQNSNTADRAANLKKGDLVYVRGRLQTQNWDGGACGKKHYRTEIVASRVDFLRSPNANPDQPEDEFGMAQPVETRDIPF